MSILSYDLPGSVLYRVLPFMAIASMLGSTVPILRELPNATVACLGMLPQLGLTKPDPTFPEGFRSITLAGMDGNRPSS